MTELTLEVIEKRHSRCDFEMTTMDLYYIKLSDISILEKFTCLTKLDLENCSLPDISQLTELNSITSIMFNK